MAIASLDNILAGYRQRILINREASRTVVLTAWSSTWDLVGNPGAGSLTIGNTANGVVPTHLTAGFPHLGFPVGAGQIGYLVAANYINTAIAGNANSRCLIYDRLFHCGSYAYNSGTTTLASQPSFSSRVPNGDYSSLELWIEAATTMAGTQILPVVTYTDQDGNAGHTTPAPIAVAGSAMPIGRCYRLPLQAGDTGLQKIESVNVGQTGMTGGTVNYFILRPLFYLRNDNTPYGLDVTLMPRIYPDSALATLAIYDSTVSGTPEVTLSIVSG
jgi:hypothetical protein